MATSLCTSASSSLPWADFQSSIQVCVLPNVGQVTLLRLDPVSDEWVQKQKIKIANELSIIPMVLRGLIANYASPSPDVIMFSDSKEGWSQYHHQINSETGMTKHIFGHILKYDGIDPVDGSALAFGQGNSCILKTRRIIDTHAGVVKNNGVGAGVSDSVDAKGGVGGTENNCVIKIDKCQPSVRYTFDGFHENPVCVTNDFSIGLSNPINHVLYLTTKSIQPDGSSQTIWINTQPDDTFFTDGNLVRDPYDSSSNLILFYAERKGLPHLAKILVNFAKYMSSVTMIPLSNTMVKFRTLVPTPSGFLLSICKQTNRVYSIDSRTGQTDIVSSIDTSAKNCCIVDNTTILVPSLNSLVYVERDESDSCATYFNRITLDPFFMKPFKVEN